jgi:DNA-binding CsgD family transcriptional regulator
MRIKRVDEIDSHIAWLRGIIREKQRERDLLRSTLRNLQRASLSIRDRRIYEYHKSGRTLRDIACIYGLHAGRVQQICARVKRDLERPSQLQGYL